MNPKEIDLSLLERGQLHHIPSGHSSGLGGLLVYFPVNPAAAPA
jgi:hypothetical protein